MTARDAEAGFSLVEVMVALAILSVAAIALVGATETHIRRIVDLEYRAVAQLVAENRAAELAIGAIPPDDREDGVTMLGGEWRIRQRIDVTEDAAIAKVELRVVSADDGNGYARLVAFIDRER